MLKNMLLLSYFLKNHIQITALQPATSSELYKKLKCYNIVNNRRKTSPRWNKEHPCEAS